MSASASWESFLAESFPAYLLPSAAAHAISVEDATRFLERLTGRPQDLSLLRAVSTLAPRILPLREFVTRSLRAWVRELPSRTEVAHREWEGGFRGALDLRRTSVHELAGRATRFVTRTRTRSFALPENVLVRATAERLLHLLVEVREAGLSLKGGWGEALGECEGVLRQLLASGLKDVPLEHPTAHHEQAAKASSFPAHRAALQWWEWLREGLDAQDPIRLAAVLARGALVPLHDHTRFEVAVVMRLIQTLYEEADCAEPAAWVLERSILLAGRQDVAVLKRTDGARVRILYNQAAFEPGGAERGAHHYWGHGGRLRPDATVITEGPDGRRRSATVIEVKHSADRGYLLSGFHEAIVYRWEYAQHLNGWPKAILVTSSPIQGDVRRGDDVIAVDWARWVPREVARGLLAPVLEASSSKGSVSLD